MTKKILIIEDEVHIQRLLTMILQSEEYTVIAAANGEEGLKKMVETTPDLILLDILMPGIDGIQVLKAIKKHPQHRNIPIIMLTALAQESVVLQGIKLGISDYVRKPFHPDELLQKIYKILVSKAQAAA